MSKIAPAVWDTKPELALTSPPPASVPPPEFAGWDRLRRPVYLFEPLGGRKLYANQAAADLWGATSVQELLARDFSQQSDAVRRRLKRLIENTAGGATVFERWTYYPKGQPVTVQTAVSAFAMPDGTVALLFEAAPAEVQEEERRAVEALRHTTNLVTLFDAAGAPLFSNPAGFAVYGRMDFVGRFEDPAHGAEILARVLAGEAVAEFCHVLTTAGRRSHHLEARSLLDPVTGQISLLLSERDVTAQVEAELAASEAHERAEVAVAKQRFLANMSHELRTPLNTVLGFGALLRGSALDAAQAGHLQRVLEAGEGLLGMINDLIILAELDGGEVRVETASIELSALLEAAASEVAHPAAAKGLQLRIEAEELGARVVADEAKLRRILHHYLVNAVKFTDAGEVVLEQSLAQTADGRAVLEIAVRDTGPGATETDRERLFERFSVADDSLRKRHAGSGLGLALCKELAALMDGEVGVETAPGRGSRFWLRLPVGLEASAARETEAGRRLRVLYADDHESNRVLVQTILGAQGHDCDVVCDGAEAVRSARCGTYDLVLMDIQMPVQDGVSAAQDIRALPAPIGQVPIIALTANTLSDQLENYARVGMNGCIAKPVNLVELITKVEACGSARPVDAAIRASA